ncbi:MAG: peroxidase-related enzyme [Pseudomonadota bacterium]
MAFIPSISSAQESEWAVMSRYMDQTKPLFALTQIVMRSGDCSLSSGQRELLAAFTSSLNRCTYCFGVHESTAQSFGVEADLLSALQRDIDTAPIEDRLKPLLRYTEKLTRAPSTVVQSDVDAIIAAGWDDNDFHYVVMICALFNFFNRLIEGYGVENVLDYRVQHGRTLHANGYRLPTDG